MADQNTSLPVRSEKDGLDERLHVKIVDGTTSPAVNQVEVDSDNNLHVEIHGNDPGAVDRVIRTSETGAITPDGIYDAAGNTLPGNVGVIAHERNSTPTEVNQKQRVTAWQPNSDSVAPADVTALDTNAMNMGFNDTAWERNRSHQNRSNVAGEGVYDGADNDEPNSAGLIASTRDAAPGVTTQTERLTSIQNAAGDKRALDVSIHDEAGEIFSDANPLPVYIANDPGTETCIANEGVDIAANATSNHDYTVPDGQVFELFQVLAAASGKMKVTVQTTTDNFATVTTVRAVRFNSTARPEADTAFLKPIVLTGASTDVKIRIIRQNKDLNAQSLYSTIIGILK